MESSVCSTMFSSVIHVIAYSIHHYFFCHYHSFYGKIRFHCPVVYHLFVICLPVDGHLDYFHFLTTMNNAGLNIYVQVLVWTYVFIFLGYTLGVELLEHMMTLYLNFQGTARLFSKVAASFYIPSSGI